MRSTTSQSELCSARDSAGSSVAASKGSLGSGHLAADDAAAFCPPLTPPTPPPAALAMQKQLLQRGVALEQVEYKGKRPQRNTHGRAKSHARRALCKCSHEVGGKGGGGEEEVKH